MVGVNVNIRVFVYKCKSSKCIYVVICQRMYQLHFLGAVYLLPLQEKPDALFIGLPPSYHGGMDSKTDIEYQLAKVGPPLS